ncbi:MAG: Coenzyme F420-reducing hydrogenase [Candidatus Alkanophagales archaeon MCA70_species_1]|nr:Coenzyme F420-reducing hydrogenase [Candidatus Alkanophaga volatiphilum]
MGACYLAWATDEKIRDRAANGGFVTAVLVAALEKDLLDAVIVVKKEDVYEGIPTVTSDPETVVECAGSLHAAPINLTRFVVEFYKDERNKGKKIGLPAKPCDARGIIEQAKRQQLDINDVYLVGLNCGGTLHPLGLREAAAEIYGIDPDAVVKEEIKAGKLFLSLQSGEERECKMDELEERGYGRRDSCKMCTTKIPTMADLACGNWGVPKGEEATFVEVLTEKGEALFRNALENGYIEVKEAPEESLEVRERIKNAMVKRAEEWWQKLDVVRELTRDERLKFYVETLKLCIHCGACRIVCPVCACGDAAKCVSMHDERDDYVISMYNMIRLLHLMDSCIGCGQCEDVCPVDIPLTLIHRRFAERMQRKLNYTPGMSVEEKPPFYEAELRWHDIL